MELFAGAGGAALGLEAAGFEHAGLVELDSDACATLLQSGLGPVVNCDVRDLDQVEQQIFGHIEASVWWQAGEAMLDSKLEGDDWCLKREELATEMMQERRTIHLLWASFPCQCFSIAGSRLGADDERNGWPWTVAAIDRFKPKAFIGENVRGLLSFDYFEDTILADLRKRYKHVGYWLLNAADFGVPQTRRRVFIYGADRPLVPPTRTHGPGMFTKPYVTMGEALQLNGKRVIGGGTNPRTAEEASTRSYRDLTDEPSTTVAAVQIGNAGPWVLDKPSPAVLANEVKGHTNPHVDRNRNYSISRASDALFLGTGRRRLTIAECGTLQGFPPNYPFQGTKKAQYRQVGNAVPPRLAQVVAQAVCA